MSYGLGPELELNNFNIVLTILGIFISCLGLISYVIKERLYISDSLIALLIGVALGPLAAHFIRPGEYGPVNEITLNLTRLVIGLQLVLAGIQLPSLYCAHKWRSLAMLVLPIMALKWVIAALIIWLIFPISYLESLVVGACVTPTDPVLANAIVKGRYAEKYVDEHIRNIISAEAGLNDGLGYPFLFLAIYLLKQPNRGAVVADWVVHICIYEILFSVAYGIIVGLIARFMLKMALDRKWVDNEAFFSFFIALSLFVIGTCGLLGTDDLLAAFAAGNAFSLHDFYRDQTADDTLQTSLDMLLNLATFVWIGATMPWKEISALDPGWRMIVMAIAILTFGRIPPVLTLYKLIPQIKSFKEAGFVAYFGPIGVGAIFYVQIALPYFETDPVYQDLYRHLKPIVYSMAFGSICVYGVTLPVVQLSSLVQPHLASLSKSISRRYTTDSKADPVARLPQWKEQESNTEDSVESAGEGSVRMVSTAHDATADVPPTHTSHFHHEHDATSDAQRSRSIQFL